MPAGGHLGAEGENMKEPWEIYYDECQRELRRSSKPSPKGLGNPRRISGQLAEAAELAAANMTVDYLVDERKWRPEDAEDAVRQLREAGPAKEALRHAWTDYQLSRRRRRRGV